MKRFLLIILLFAGITYSVQAQSRSDWIFDDSVLPEVHITIDQDSLDLILQPGNEYSDHEYPATFVIIKGAIRDTVEQIGFRLRGNTSRVSAKKSFKVSFNTFVDGREYYGLDKMNLNGEHNDPSIMRAKLSWDIFEKTGLASSRSNHMKLYINGEYKGLYLNVEHIDNEFVEDRFGTDAGNLYKCLYPADLSFRGVNANEYKFIPVWADRRTYDLKTNTEEDDYSDLAYLIYFLENSSAVDFEKRIEDILNVDGVLRWMAVDILTGMWDDYWFNQNNYYLYHDPESGQFNFIPYDYDNSFGIWWDGIYPGIDWAERDINNWGHPDQDRPLTRRILEVPKYKDRLNYYVHHFIETAFNESLLFPEIDRLKAMTEAAAEDDTYRTLDYGYTFEDYNNSFDQALGAHVTYGLKPYISARVTSAMSQLELNDIVPVLLDPSYHLIKTETGYRLDVSVSIVDEGTPGVAIKYMLNEQEASLLSASMTESTETPGLFIVSVPIDDPTLESVSFYIEATDTGAQTGRFPNNTDRNILLETNPIPSINGMVINEFMADNETGIQDEFGAFEDWIELYNPTGNTIDLSGYYLTDDFTVMQKWALPDTTIPPGGYFVVWADNDDEEGPLHTNFGLNNDGEQIGLFYKDVLELYIADTLSFGPQTDDVSYGRVTDGASDFKFFDFPSPGTHNGGSVSNEEEAENPSSVQLFQNYPNPFNPETNIQFQLDMPGEVKLQIFAVDGRLIETLIDSRLQTGTHSIRFDASELSSGIYFYRLITGDQRITKRFTLIK